jgi:hypothetical protein
MIIYAKGKYHALNGEIWSFERRYVAVSDGRVLTIEGTNLRSREWQNTLSLIDDTDIIRNVRINRFILYSFIEEKPPEKYHADHLDEEKPNDNSLSNLQWLSPRDNNLKKT